MTVTKEMLKKIFQESGADVMVALDRKGNETSVLFGKREDTEDQSFFPLMTEEYEWGREEQIQRAKQFRDRIEYLYHPEDDETHPMLSTWRLDDTERLKTTLMLPFGKKVLESGCSSGTVSIEIAKLPQVEKVVGVDIRDDAIDIAHRLVQERVEKGDLTGSDAEKLTFQVRAIEDLEYPVELFDSVCAFEVLEHLTPADFEKAVPALIRLMKPDGNFLVSLPNRYPDQTYMENIVLKDKDGNDVSGWRARWNAPDHKNFFSKTSLEYYLKQYFHTIEFYSVEGRPVDRGVYLMCSCTGKK